MPKLISFIHHDQTNGRTDNPEQFDLWENVEESSCKENASAKAEKERGQDHLLRQILVQEIFCGEICC